MAAHKRYLGRRLRNSIYQTLLNGREKIEKYHTKLFGFVHRVIELNKLVKKI